MTEVYRPSMKSLFITALRATAKEDTFRNNKSILDLFYENTTFNDRVLANFIIIATGYYSKEEIINWFEDEFFSNERLPDESLFEIN